MEVFIVDNASKDNSVEVLKKDYPDITLIENKNNVGFGRANNQALPLIKGRYVLLLNTDAFIQTDTISKNISYMESNPKVGILGVKLLGRDGQLQPSCRYFPTPWVNFLQNTGLKSFFKNSKMVDDMDWDHASIRECDWVPGCYYLVRKTVIDEVGLFDPLYFLYCEEVDHCFAAKRAGWQVIYYPFTPVVHIGGESAKSEGNLSSKGRQIQGLQIESELLYFRKNLGVSGLATHLILTILSDSIQMLKDILRLRSFKIVYSNFQHMYLVVKLLFDSKFGMKSTR